jgi:hypothetical protein
MPKPPTQQQGHSDHFQTPPLALKALLPFIPANVHTIWEPACGLGNLVRQLRNAGYAVQGSDIIFDQDFMTYEAPAYDLIVTNPPYSLKNEFFSRAYELGKPFAYLLPYTALETESRQKLFRTHGLELILFNKRINFDTPSGEGSGAWFPTGWFTWGMHLPQQLTFVDLDNL